MINLVRDTINKYSLINKGDRVLVGLSGGADSMCLLHVLCCLSKELNITVAAAHLNHNIRGESAEHDAKASKEAADSLGAEFYLKSENVREYAAERGISEELAGRKLRYRFFSELQEKYNFNKIATAHNKNDNAETLLMNFVRGSGIAGLCGIPVKRENIIRPLIEVSRDKIESYCHANNLEYVTDLTNLETVYTRNKIRLDIIPQITKLLNPNFINTVTNNAHIIRDENNYISCEAIKIFKQYNNDGMIPLSVINTVHVAIARRIIMQMIEKAGGSLADISSFAADMVIKLCKECKTGKSIDIFGNITARTEYGKLIIEKKQDEVCEFDYVLNENKTIYIPEINAYASLKKTDERINDNGIYISADNTHNIHIRNRRNGDIFYPVGMNGRKKIKELFIDMKIPGSKRMCIPIITVGNDIAAVYNMRIDKRYVFKKNNIGFKIVINWE